MSPVVSEPPADSFGPVYSASFVFGLHPLRCISPVVFWFRPVVSDIRFYFQTLVYPGFVKSGLCVCVCDVTSSEESVPLDGDDDEDEFGSRSAGTWLCSHCTDGATKQAWMLNK